MARWVSAITIQVMLEAFRMRGLDERRRCAEASVSEQALASGARVPDHVRRRLLTSACRAARRAELAIEGGLALPFGALGLMDYLAASADTLGGSCEALARHFDGVSSDHDLELESSECEYRLELVTGEARADAPEHDDFALGALRGRVVGFSLAAVRLRRAPPAAAARFEALLGAPATFGHAASTPCSGNVEGVPFPRDHAGISGNTIQQVADRVDAALAANPPHVVLLQIGANNLYQGMAADVPGQLASLLDRITEGAPDALVAVAQVTPLGGQFPNGGVEEYDAAIPGIDQERVAAGKHRIVVDPFTRIASTADFVAQLLPDDIHPNGAGYAILGETWFEAIEPYLP